MQHCSAKTKTGAPCRAPASSQGLCFFHANPEKAPVLGQIGGRKNRSRLPEPSVAGPLSAAGLRDILAEAICDVRSKKITPRTASALSQLSNSLCRVLPTADLEARVARLELQLAGQESPTSMNTDPTTSGGEDQTGSGMGVQPRDGKTAASGGADGKTENDWDSEKG